MKKVIISFMMLLVMSSTVFGAIYHDVSDEHWASEAISEMTNRGIINGYPDGTFRPNNLVTRAEFAKILVSSLNLTEKGTDIIFEDVSSSHWANKYIQIASNYLSGYVNGNKIYYRPDEYAVREDMTIAMVNALGLKNNNYSLSTLDRFSDKDDIAENLKKYVAIAVENGLINGYPDSTFKPKGKLTRAETSKLILNTLNNIDDLQKIAISDVEDLENNKIMKKVSLGEVAKFARKLEKGKDFRLTVNGNTIEGKMWRDGKIFELYPYFEGRECTEQYDVKELTNSWCTMYGAKQKALTYGFKLISSGDDVRFIYEKDNVIYYADSKVEDTHVESDVIDNFVCFVLNNDKNVKVRIVSEETIELTADKPNGSTLRDTDVIKLRASNYKQNNGTLDYRIYYNNSLLLPGGFYDGDSLKVKDIIEYAEKRNIDLHGKEIMLTLFFDNLVENKTEGKVTYTYKIADNSVPVQSIKMNFSNLSMSIKNGYTFSATIQPSNATDKTITWTTSDSKIATIDQNGRLTPKGVGNITVTATSSNGKKSECAVKIYALKYDSTILNAGDTVCIVHGADKLNSFASSNIKVAKVDQEGNVTALSGGQATITCKDVNDTLISCLITVKDENTVIEPVVLKINKTEFYDNETITIAVKSGKLQGSEVIVWDFELDGRQIATNSGYSMKVSQLLSIAAKRYASGDIHEKEITLRACPRDVRDNSDRETTEFKIKVKNEPFILKLNKTEFYDDETINLAIKSGKLQDAEAIVWEFELDGKQIATNSGYSMKVSLLLNIAAKRYNGDIHEKEIILRACPRDVRDNSDRETTEFKIKVKNEPFVLKLDKTEFYDDETINLAIKSGKLQDAEAIVWEFELDGKQIATNSGYSMKVSLLLNIAAKRYNGDIHEKEIILRAWPRSVRDNSDREATEFRITIKEESNISDPQVGIIKYLKVNKLDKTKQDVTFEDGIELTTDNGETISSNTTVLVYRVKNNAKGEELIDVIYQLSKAELNLDTESLGKVVVEVDGLIVRFLGDNKCIDFESNANRDKYEDDYIVLNVFVALYQGSQYEAVSVDVVDYADLEFDVDDRVIINDVDGSKILMVITGMAEKI